MNMYNAARAAGYSESIARKHPETLEKAVKSGMAEAMEQAGLTDKFLSARLAEGCLAEKTVSVESDMTNENGKNIWVHVTVPDHQARAKFVELSSKMSGRLTDKLAVTGIPGTVVNVYPTKTVIFRDINDSDSERNRSLHVAESSARSLPEGAVQSP